ncbi:class I SAM-dependent methyltransferase [Prauserella sp. PE36]|nr:class I SAM-dependent methyltransferase [Prauserella sp. PE36]
MEAGVPIPGGRRLGLANRAARSAAVASQYQDAAEAAGYVAAHDGWGPTARYFHSRLHVVQELLKDCPGGDLLDAGCGPGMLVRRLLDTRAEKFHITACDRSPAMIEAVVDRTFDATNVELVVASIEDMPVGDASFDVVVAMGVLEYTDLPRALRELSRVVRPGGLMLVTMLNPASPYRLFEWGVYWPALRLLGRLERRLGVPAANRHGARVSGIRAVGAKTLRRMLHQVGMQPEDVVYYDLTPLVPPLDRLARRWARRWRDHPERTASRGTRRWMGTGYLVAARRPLV